MPVPMVLRFHLLLLAQGSVTQGKGHKLAGLEMARFRQAIMRQTGFIEPDSS